MRVMNKLKEHCSASFSLLFLWLLLAGCGDQGGAAASVQLVSIGVTAISSSLAVGTTLQLTAMGIYSDQSTQDLTAQVSWTSFDPAVARVENGGLAAAVAPGKTEIRASLSGVSGKTNITVTPEPLVALGITPTNPSIAKGTTQSFVATGIFSGASTQDLTTQVLWASSNPAVATVDSQGLAKGLGPGTTTISATRGGVIVGTQLIVTAAALVSISVTSPNPSMAKGTGESFTATGTYTDGSIFVLTSQVTWASSDINVATIRDTCCVQGFAIGVGTGVTTISATLDGKIGSTTLTVTAATLAFIFVNKDNDSIAKGTREQFRASGHYTDQSILDITTQVTWASSDTTVADISNAAGSQGLAIGVGPGSTSISATLDGKTGSSSLTVSTLVSIEVQPQNSSIAKGTTQKFRAIGTNADGSIQDLTEQVTWASSDTSVATVSNAAGSRGLATGISSGSTSISVTLDGKTDSTSLTVI